MRRFRNLFNYSLSCINRYKIRTLVVLICLGVSAALFSSVAFMKDGLVAEGELSLKYSPDMTVQGISAGRQTTVDTRTIGYVQEAPGVIAVVPRIWGYGNIGNTLLVIVGIELEKTPFNQYANVNLTNAYPIEAGSFIDPQSNNTVVIGKGVADLLGVTVGSVLTILAESNQPRGYIVVGVFNSESSIYSADMILMNINEARSFFDVPEDKVTDILVYVSNIDPVNKASLVNLAAREISDLPNCRVVTKDVLLKAQETTYGDRSGFFSVVWYVILISVAIIAFNQTVVVGHESKFEVGLLKSLGFSTSDIIQVRLVESAVLGTIAASVGITFGILYDAVLGAPVLKDFMMGWATLYPGFPVPVLISSTTVLFTFAVTIVPLLFATVIPSWLNATVDPDIAMRGAGSMIEAINLSKIYNLHKRNQVEAVTDANVAAESGEITAFVGPSGCGKTTLMSMIGQLLTPTKGKILVDKEDITAYSDGWKAVFRRNNIGFVFQHINLLPNLNALENVMTPLICHDVDPAQYKDSALRLLEQLGLSERAFFNVEQLSGGQQQRVAVARALITEPNIIVADEPLTFVDEASAKTITDFFEKLKGEGKTILISTHVSNLAKLADKTYVMKDGKIVDTF